jgi:hypothetical protein
MRIKLPEFCSSVTVRSAAGLTAATLVWFIILPRAGFLVPVVGFMDFHAASLPLFIGTALLLWRWPGALASLYCLVLAWLLLIFLETWSVGVDTLSTLKVLVPVGDSAGYSYEAASIAQGLPASPWGGWRILSHALFSAWTWLFGRDLLLIHAASAALAALCLTFCVRAVASVFGRVLAAAFLVVCGQFYYQYMGTFATELYGLSVGLLGTALLLSGVRDKRLSWQFMGLFALGLAIAARAGAFFVLPLAGLGAASLQDGWRRRALVLAGAAASVLASIALNHLLTRFLCEAGAAPFSNFWYSFHGLLIGQNWSVSAASNNPQQAMSASMVLLREHPFLIFSASWKAVAFFFGQFVAFTYIKPVWLGKVLTVLLPLGAGYCVLRIRAAGPRILLAALVGILVSIPFVPPWDASIRPYASTIPLQVIGALLLPGLALSWLACKANLGLKLRVRPAEALRGVLAPALLAVVVFVGAVLPLLFVNTPMHAGKPGAWVGGGKASFPLISGSYLRIVPDDSRPHSYVPFIRRADFRSLQQGFSYYYMADSVLYDMLPPGVLITRSDSVGNVFVIMDDFGPVVPERAQMDAEVLLLRGDSIVYDTRLGLDREALERGLEAVYLPWFTGLLHYFPTLVNHPAMGDMSIVKREPGGTLGLWSDKFGRLDTSKAMFPRFRRESDGHILLLDIEAGRLLDETSGECLNP